jgi:inner membrane protein
MEILSKPEETPVTVAAKQSYLGRVYLDWAKFPITERSPTDDGGYLVRFYDLRFGPAAPGARRPLSAGVLLDRNLRVVKEFMGGASQPAPD